MEKRNNPCWICETELSHCWISETKRNAAKAWQFSQNLWEEVDQVISELVKDGKKCICRKQEMKVDQEKYEMKADQESVMVKKKSKFTR